MTQTDPTTRDMLVAWLVETRSPEVLAEEVAELFYRRGPRLPRRMRRCLRRFLEDCPVSLLAMCVAISGRIDDRDAFAAWRYERDIETGGRP